MAVRQRSCLQTAREVNSMAYFDSPKNRAMWDKRMTVLRAERKRRESEGYKPQQKSEAPEMEFSMENPLRRQLTVKELEEIVAMIKGGNTRHAETEDLQRTQNKQKNQWNVTRKQEELVKKKEGRER